MEQNKGFWYADWSFPIFVGLLSSGVFAGTHMYYLYGIGAFNEVAFVAMLKSGIDTGVYGAVAAFGASFLFGLNLGDVFFNRRTDLRPFVFNQSAIEVDSNNFCVIHDFSFSCHAAFGIGAVDHPTKRHSLKFFFSLSALLIARSMPEKLFRWK